MTHTIADKLEPVTIPRELFDFLMGAGEIDGASFGDLQEGLPGRFWWRALLRTALSATPPQSPAVELSPHGRFEDHSLGKLLCNLRTSKAGDFVDPQHSGQRGEDWDNGLIAACKVVETYLRTAALSASPPSEGVDNWDEGFPTIHDLEFDITVGHKKKATRVNFPELQRLIIGGAVFSSIKPALARLAPQGEG